MDTFGIVKRNPDVLTYRETVAAGPECLIAVHETARGVVVLR